MERVYNKLVRDNIPSIIAKDNEVAKTRILSDEEFKNELERKLREECEEVINSTDSEEIMKELADIVEVVNYLAKLEGKTLDDVLEVAKQKREERGGFDKKVFLENVIWG